MTEEQMIYQKGVILYVLSIICDSFYDSQYARENMQDAVCVKVDIETAIRLLSPPEREIVHRLFRDGETVRQAAREMGKSIGYVSETAQRALRKICEYCAVYV